MNEYTISTPTGLRVLVEIPVLAEKFSLAHIRPGFAPNEDIASQRLQISEAYDHIHRASDGTFINAKSLWSILIGQCKPGKPVHLDYVNDAMFHPTLKRDLHPILVKLFESYNPNAPYWQSLSKHAGQYDPISRMISRNQ